MQLLLLASRFKLPASWKFFEKLKSQLLHRARLATMQLLDPDGTLRKNHCNFHGICIVMRFWGEETKGLKNWNLTNLDINLTRPKIKKNNRRSFYKGMCRTQFTLLHSGLKQIKVKLMHFLKYFKQTYLLVPTCSPKVDFRVKKKFQTLLFI